MFKKLKDKLAEEVKSSPQRIQQFAQAAQAAVTSASSSISDITNNDLFSIGGDDTPTQSSPGRPDGTTRSGAPPNFQDVSLGQGASRDPRHDREATPTNDDHFEQEPTGTVGGAGHRLRKLSTGSAASDVSFRLPSYESPSMYHLQSDLEDASEAESVAGGPNLERVSKEQVYAAYRRTRDRYARYRARYADLARHYKTLERENAKARAVLVETQDKALRRISELREQCSLEQSAKAHLENALRVELDQRSLKINALNTKIKLLQSYNGNVSPDNTNESKSEAPDTVTSPVHDLIDLAVEAETPTPIATPVPEITILNNKIQKMEQLVAKYKESLKTFKEKNSQLTTEIQIVSNELDKKGKENEQLQAAVKQLTAARQQLQELKENKNELQLQLDNYDKTKAEEISKARTELEKAHSDIISLNKQINIFTKREEENAISLAENKLSIHKELESKEAEIKLLKGSLTAAHSEIKSYELITDELKQSLKKLEEEKAVLIGKLSELQSAKKTISDLEHKVEDLNQQSLSHEQRKSKIMEEYKCLELQMKQETAEKLAMIDRNNYLENRNQQLTEDNSKKNKQIADLEKEFMDNNSSESKQDIECETLRKEKNTALEEMKIWKSKYNKLESEIKEERVELVKLQSEIEKLLHNYEKLQIENIELTGTVSDLQSQIQIEKEQREVAEQQFQIVSKDLQSKLKIVKQELSSASVNMKAMEKEIHQKVMQEAQTQMQSIEATIKESYDIKMAEFMSTQMVSSSNEDSDKLALELEELRQSINAISEEKKLLEETLHNHKQLSQEKEILEQRTKELESSFAELKNLKHDFEQMQSEKDALKLQVETLDKDNDKLTSKAEQILKKNELLSQQKEDFEKTIQKAESEISMLSKFKNDFNEALAEKDGLILKIESLETENQSLKSKTDQIIKDVATLQKELTEVKESHDQIEEEKDRLVSKISDMEMDELNKIEKERELYNETLYKNEEIKKNVDKLNLEMESLLAEKSKIYNQLLESQYDSKEKATEIMNYKETNEVWQQKLASILEENNILHEKCERLKQEKESFHETVIRLEQKLSECEKKLKQQEESTIEKEFLDLRINQLEKDLNCVNLEKDKLVQQSVDLNESLKKEKADNEQFHTKIQDLNKNSENEKIASDSTISEMTAANKNQTETIISLQKDIDSLKKEYGSLLKEFKTMKDKERLYIEDQNNLKSENEQLYERIKDLAHIENEHNILQMEYVKLKEDKSRLASDIEGLQVHLTKVSKDNSQLNDRIRDMISHDEDSTNNTSEKYKDDTSMKVLQEIEGLKNDLKSRLDQIEDLERQNSILVEEKLELDDQIKSQNSSNETGNHIHSTTEKELEIARLREKNNDLQEVKMQLESKLADLELQSRSGDSSVQHLEQKNEKLRLNNDKLERRLDEALVSLRHLRALEENTELEYLRNILYEYLTGSGTHSITLAKVLAAVVKFDERQTQLVLQREKERQGLLGQLGLL